MSTASAVRIEACRRSCGRGRDRRRCRRVRRVDQDGDSHDARPVGHDILGNVVSPEVLAVRPWRLLWGRPRRDDVWTLQFVVPATSASDTITSKIGNGPLRHAQVNPGQAATFRLIPNAAHARQPADPCPGTARPRPQAQSLSTFISPRPPSGSLAAGHFSRADRDRRGDRPVRTCGQSGRCPHLLQLALNSPLHTPEREAMQTRSGFGCQRYLAVKPQVSIEESTSTRSRRPRDDVTPPAESLRAPTSMRQRSVRLAGRSAIPVRGTSVWMASRDGRTPTVGSCSSELIFGFGAAARPRLPAPMSALSYSAHRDCSPAPATARR